jgi:hypothetical protein
MTTCVHWERVRFVKQLPLTTRGAHQRIRNTLVEQKGPLGNWQYPIPGDPAVAIHQIPVNDQSDAQVLFTVGLSDHRLPEGRREYSCSELSILLSPNWPLTGAALQDPRWNWPIEWMAKIVRHLRTATRWPEEPVVFMNGDPPLPLAPNTKLCGWLSIDSTEKTHQAPDYRWITFRGLFPIYVEEFELVRRSGSQELVNLFLERDVPLFIDPQRGNVAGGGKRDKSN